MASASPLWASSNCRRRSSSGVSRCGGPPSSCSRPCCQVEPHRALLEGRRGGLAVAAAQEGADAGQQGARAEGFGEVVVGPAVEAAHQVVLLAAHRQHQDRHRRLQPRICRHTSKPFEIRQVDVEHHQVGLLVAPGRERRLAARPPRSPGSRPGAARRRSAAAARGRRRPPGSSCRGLRGPGSADPEAGAVRLGRLGEDPPAVPLDDGLDDEKAEPQPAVLR